MEGGYCRYWFATTDGNLRHESSIDGFKMGRVTLIQRGIESTRVLARPL